MPNRFHCYILQGGARVSHAEFDRRSQDAAVRRVLLSHHADSSPIGCSCSPAAAAALHVCVRGQTVFLRRSVDTHALHASDCRHAEPPDKVGGDSKDHVKGIRPTDDGGFKVSLETSVFPSKIESRASKVTNVSAGAATTATPPAGKSFGRTTALGLMRFLMEQAAANEWSPQLPARVAEHLGVAIDEESRKCEAGRLGPLSGCLTSFVPIKDKFDLCARVEKSTGGTASVRELLVISPLLGLIPPGPGKRLWRLQLGGRMPPVFAAPDVVEKGLRSFRLFAERDDCGRFRHLVWTVMAVRNLAFGDTVLPLASSFYGQGMTRTFVPVESPYEVTFCDHLTRWRRAFYKPIRLRDSDEMLPDFVLVDSDPWVNVEVLGSNNPEYRARIEGKRHLTTQSGRQFLVWDAVNSMPLPPLPVASARR